MIWRLNENIEKAICGCLDTWKSPSLPFRCLYVKSDDSLQKVKLLTVERGWDKRKDPGAWQQHKRQTKTSETVKGALAWRQQPPRQTWGQEPGDRKEFWRTTITSKTDNDPGAWQQPPRRTRAMEPDNNLQACKTVKTVKDPLKLTTAHKCMTHVVELHSELGWRQRPMEYVLHRSRS